MWTCYWTWARGIASMHSRAWKDTVNIANTRTKGLEWVCNLHDAQKPLLSKKYPQSHLKGRQKMLNTAEKQPQKLPRTKNHRPTRQAPKNNFSAAGSPSIALKIPKWTVRQAPRHLKTNQHWQPICQKHNKFLKFYIIPVNFFCRNPQRRSWYFYKMVTQT